MYRRNAYNTYPSLSIYISKAIYDTKYNNVVLMGGSMWITREETWKDYDIYDTEPSWGERWQRWIGTPSFTVEPKLLERLRPDLKMVGGEKQIKKIIKKK